MKESFDNIDKPINILESRIGPSKMTQEDIHRYIIDMASVTQLSANERVRIVLHEILPQEIDAGSRDERGETNWDRVYRELPGLYVIDDEFAHTLHDRVAQNGYMVRPDVFVGIIFDQYCKDPYSYFVDDALRALDYVIRISSDSVGQYLAEKIDFQNPEYFDTTVNMLDLLTRLFRMDIGTWSDAGPFTERVSKILEKAILGNEGSYLLQLSAKKLVEIIHARERSLTEAKLLSGEPEVAENYMLSRAMKDSVDQELGIKVDELSALEQIYFLDYIKMKPAKEILGIKEFCSKYGKSGLRTFLALQHNKSLGDQLIVFGNKVERPVAQAVFDKYGEIVDLSQQIVEYLRREFGDTIEFTSEVVSEISDKLLKEGTALLEKYMSDEEGSTPESVADSLEAIKTDTLAFLSAFKTLKTNKAEFSLDDVKNLELTTVPANEIPPTDIEAMAAMYKANYARYPKLAAFLTRKFEEAISQDGATMSILKRNGVIVAFYRLGPMSTDRAFYFGSFNVDPTYQGAMLGETLMQESLDVKARDNVIFAECNPHVAVSANYIERGFIAVAKDHVEEIDVLKIVRNDRLNTELVSRAVSSADIVAHGISKENVHVYSTPTKDLERFNFDFVGKKRGDSTEILTRYIRDKGSGMTYFVTEEVSEEFLDRYSNSM